MSKSARNQLCHSTEPQTGNTPLHVAASVGYVQAVALILQTEKVAQHQVWQSIVDKNTALLNGMVGFRSSLIAGLDCCTGLLD